MLKNTKVVGIAAAVALLTGVAIAPSATAIGTTRPELSVTDTYVYSGDVVEYYVDYVRAGCKVITTLGGKTRTERATKVDGDRDGAVVDKQITAPKQAGEYQLRSMVGKECASDAGYKNPVNMSETITVGEEITGIDDWETVGARAVRIYGTAYNEVDEEDQDLGTVKIQAYVKGKVVSSTYTDGINDGDFAIVIESKYLNKRGNTKVTLHLSSNLSFWMDEYIVVDRTL